MTDFFKSAFGMFGSSNGMNSQAGNASPALSASRANVSSNDFVGQIIMIGSYKLKITRLLAEG